MTPSFGRLLLPAPAILIVHFLEEGPRFVTWFNAHVSPGITVPLFWAVNGTALAITLGVVALEWLSASAASAALAVAWLGFLMLANALFHVAAALVDGAYMPGLLTALLLYLPYYAWVVRRTVELHRLRPAALVTAAAVGALPMLAHGYLIVFRGSRLF